MDVYSIFYIEMNYNKIINILFISKIFNVCTKEISFVYINNLLDFYYIMLHIINIMYIIVYLQVVLRLCKNPTVQISDRHAPPYL